jgi:hypothetical protein
MKSMIYYENAGDCATYFGALPTGLNCGESPVPTLGDVHEQALKLPSGF